MSTSNKLRRKNSSSSTSTSSLHINDARIAGLYDLEHTIGKGHFAVVKLARHVFTGEKVAVKVIDKTRLDPVSQEHMMQEVRCMKLVQHPNIVRLYEVIDTQTKLFLILELGDYDMYEWVMRRPYEKGCCGETEAQLYFSQIVKAINYCHKLHVVHRDLKPENVVFFERLGMVKLTDFGFSNLFIPGEQLQTSCGSLAYSAPEILLGDSYDAPAVDVWSLGVILYMLVCGRLPFQESNDSETLTRILDCKFSFPDHVSIDCRRLISSMLLRDPAHRATLEEIVQNTWVGAGDRGHAEALPLIIRDHLPVCAHATIVEQMVAGKIGGEEEILNAIEQNEYNHLTATYFLLAERVLACYRQTQANRLMALAAAAAAEENCCPSGCGDLSQLSNGGGTATTAQSVPNRSRSRSNSWRGPAPRRAYSILKEESEEELSSYNLRSSSRQSSRFFNVVPPAAGVALGPKSRDSSSRANLLVMSRANSNDSFAPGPSAILEDDVEVDEQQQSSSSGDQHLIHLNETTTRTTMTPSTAPTVDLPPPSATSTPFMQRILAPICEFRDQSPDTVDDAHSSSATVFGGNGVRRVRPSSAVFCSSAPRPMASRGTQSAAAGQLPPPPSSPDKMRTRGGGHQHPRMRNATSLELFPMVGTGGKENGSFLLLEPCSATSPPTPNPSNGVVHCWSNMLLERHPNFTNLSNLPTSSTSNLIKPPLALSLSRRNSSPSVPPTFRATSSLHSSCDRISPHAIQELLELSRLSGRMRRTASPDSRLSSRSPSPSCMSSGRTSPAVSGISSRLKTTNFLPTIGGMRKLSSSPHLLGICEETEEGDMQDFLGQHSVFCLNVGVSEGSETNRRQDFQCNGKSASTVAVRSARSASMGLGTLGRMSMPKMKFTLQTK
uniref:SNF-related serine/threonine-protein kinase n=1 Tax=Globodera rostochiensis TaxID=31243 RepID=A0A914ICF9_GLORO